MSEEDGAAAAPEDGAQIQPPENESGDDSQVDEGAQASDSQDDDDSDDGDGEGTPNPDDGDEGSEDDAGDDDGGATDQKELNKRGYAERTRIRSGVTNALDSLARPQTAEQLAEQYNLDPAMAEVEALKQENQRREVINQITELNADLNMDANNVVRDFSWADESNKKTYDSKFAQEVEQRYKEWAGVKTDPSGQYVVSASIPLYEFYAWANSIRGTAAQQSTTRAQKSAERMLAAADTPASTGASRKQSKGDSPFLKGLQGSV